MLSTSLEGQLQKFINCLRKSFVILLFQGKLKTQIYFYYYNRIVLIRWELLIQQCILINISPIAFSIMYQVPKKLNEINKVLLSYELHIL